MFESYIICFFSTIMMDSLKVIILFYAIGGSIQVFRPPFSPPMPPRKAKARDFQPMRPRDSRETTLEVPEDQEPGGPPGMARFLRVQFLLTQKIGGLGKGRMMKDEFDVSPVFFFKKRKHRRRWLEDLQWMNVAGCLFGRGLL